jgi:hypothetical protein
VCFSQSLTALVSALMGRLWCRPPDTSFLSILTQIGKAFFPHHLSSYRLIRTEFGFASIKTFQFKEGSNFLRYRYLIKLSKIIKKKQKSQGRMQEPELVPELVPEPKLRNTATVEPEAKEIFSAPQY